VSVRRPGGFVQSRHIARRSCSERTPREYWMLRRFPVLVELMLKRVVCIGPIRRRTRKFSSRVGTAATRTGSLLGQKG
jgi:hypothetical protein